MLAHFKRLFGQIFYYGIGDAVTKSIVVLILPIFTRYLTPADYGVAAILTVATVLISGVADLGLSVSTYRFYYEGEGKDKKALATAMFSQVLLTTVIAAFAIIFSKNISVLFFKTTDFSYILSLAFLSIPLNDISVTPLNFLKLEGKARTCTLFKVAKALTDVGLKIVLVIFLGRGITGLFEAQLLNAALYAVLFGIYAARKIGFGYSATTWKKMVVFGLPFAASTVFFWVLNWADRFILGRLTNMTEVGLYTLGYTLGMAIMLPVGAFSTAWPAFYMSVVKGTDTKKFFSLVLTYFSLVLGYFILIITIFSRDYFIFLTPKEFHGAYIIVPLIVISYTFLGQYSIMITGTYLKKETRWIFLTELLSVILNVGLMFLLIPRFGRLGAAFATAISYGLLLIFIYSFTFKIFPIRYEYNRLLKIFLTLALLFWVSQTIYEPNILNITLRFLLTLCYPVLLYLLGFFDQRELELFKKYISARLHPLTPLEQKIANKGERLVPKVPTDPEVVRHKSSYLFFKKIIESDSLITGHKKITILDLGCGVGHGTFTLSKIEGAQVTGIDNSKEAIAYAKEHFRGKNINYRVAEIGQFLKKSQEYDYLVSRGVLEHIPKGLDLIRKSQWRYRLIFDVPYNEKPGPNPYHLITNISEKEFVKFPFKELFYEDLAGKIFDETLKPADPNMIVCVSGTKNLPAVASYKYKFPLAPWQGKKLDF